MLGFTYTACLLNDITHQTLRYGEWLPCLQAKVCIQISACTVVILNEKFRGFPQSLQVNAGIVFQIRPQTTPSPYFQYIKFHSSYREILHALSYSRRH